MRDLGVSSESAVRGPLGSVSRRAPGGRFVQLCEDEPWTTGACALLQPANPVTP